MFGSCVGVSGGVSVDLALKQAVVVITGGSAGLGAALAANLVKEGARVAICARDESRLEATAAGLSADGGEILAVPADVSIPSDIDRYVAAVIDRWGRVDGLVNNAGTASGGAFEEQTDQMWHDDLELKVMGAVRLTRQLLPHMRSAGGGAIVNVLNDGAKAPGAKSLPTAASRAAGLAITKALSKELGPDGIRVNAVLIGMIRSAQHDRKAAAAGKTPDEYYQWAGGLIGAALGRVGQPEEFADVVSFLLSPRASYITGSAINIDGGKSPAI